jgi:hypothetical protein
MQRVIVNVAESQVAVEEFAMRGQRNSSVMLAVDLPPTDGNIVSIGWNDEESHVETDPETGLARHVQEGIGVILRNDGKGGMVSERILDRSIIEPYVAAYKTAEAKRNATQSIGIAASRTAPILPEGFLR